MLTEVRKDVYTDGSSLQSFWTAGDLTPPPGTGPLEYYTAVKKNALWRQVLNSQPEAE